MGNKWYFSISRGSFFSLKKKGKSQMTKSPQLPRAMSDTGQHQYYMSVLGNGTSQSKQSTAVAVTEACA